MSLIKRKPALAKGRLIKLKEAAELLNCSHDSIRSGAIGNFKLIRLGDKPTSPFYVDRSEVEKFFQQRFSNQ